MLSPSNMNTSLDKLSLREEKLKTQRWCLRETVAELDNENQNLLKESEDLKDGCRRLQGRARCLRTSVGDLCSEVDDARDSLEDKENKIKQLELQNKDLDRINEQLKAEIIELSFQTSAYRDRKTFQQRDTQEVRNMFENQNYLKCLQIKLEFMEELYEQEKVRAQQLRSTVEELEKVREAQRKWTVQIKAQLEKFAEEAALGAVKEHESRACPSSRHAPAAPEPPEGSAPLLKRQNSFSYIWSILKILLLARVCSGLPIYSFINSNILLFSSVCIFYILVHILYPCFGKHKQLRAQHRRSTPEELEEDRDAQKKSTVQMKAQLEEFTEGAALGAVKEHESQACPSSGHAPAAPEPPEGSAPLLKRQNSFSYIWSILKLLPLVRVCFGLVIYSLISNAISQSFSDCVFYILAHIFYSSIGFKNEGLLPC